MLHEQFTWFLDCCILSLCWYASLFDDSAGSECIEPTGVGYKYKQYVATGKKNKFLSLTKSYWFVIEINL